MRHRLGSFMVAIAVAALSAPAAHAAPLDLDPSFGTGGVALAPAGIAEAQGAPVVQAGGATLVAGVDQATNRAVVHRFTAKGAPDTSFGTGGVLRTDLRPTFGRVAVADAGAGAFQIVTGSEGGRELTLQRYAANGTLQSTVRASVPSTSTVWPTAAVVRPGGVTYVAAKIECGSWTFCFGLLKVKGSGLDPAFGEAGVARRALASYSRPLAIGTVAGTDGRDRILLAGSRGYPGFQGTDTAVARFLDTGALDTTFDGDGIATTDASGAGRDDYAVALVADAAGGVTVAGRANGSGHVTRFTAGGALDPSFATGGVLRDLQAGGTSYEPTAMTAGGAGQLLVAGMARDSAANTVRWSLTQLTPGGALERPTRRIEACTAGTDHGPSGVTSGGGRIHVAGSCGTDGRAAVARLFAGDALRGGLSLSVSAEREAAGHERVRLSKIDPTTVLGAVEPYVSAPLGSGPLGSGPLGSGPLGSGPLGSGPLGSGPLGSGPLGSGPLGSGPLGSGGINATLLLSDLPLVNDSWVRLLTPVYGEGNVPPLQTITLADVYVKAPEVVNGLEYGDLDLSRTPLSRASLASVVLTRPLSSVPAPAVGWCAFLDGQPFSCADGVDVDSTTLFELEYRGDDLSDYYAKPLMLAAPGTNLGSGDARALLAYVPLISIDLGATPFGAVQASAVSALLKCGASCTGTLADVQAADPENFSSATLGELVALLPLPGLADVSLGQVLGGMVHPANIPYEDADRRALLDAADLRDTDLQAYSASFEADCAQVAALDLLPVLAGDARFVPGSATVALGSAAPRPLADPRGIGGGERAFDLAPACAGAGITRITVTFVAEPGSTLGPDRSRVELRSGGEARSAAVGVAVDDSRDPGDDPSDALALGTDALRHGWISSAGDLDHYTFTAPAAGTKVSITLSHLPADFDVQVYGPVNDVDNTQLHAGPLGSGPLGSGPLGSGPLGSGPLGSGAVPDSTTDIGDPAVVEPDRVQDFPLGSGPLGSGPLGSGSIHRGTEAEAVTFRVRRADAGKPITVRVSGYNGASADEPYVLRRLDTRALEQPPCPARSGMAAGAPGSWPSSVPADTETIFLVNRQRLAALNGASEATRVMDGLAAVAARTKGVVASVESAPAKAGVGAAYAAWDADPCNEDQANGVVEAINLGVDELRSAGNGLTKLRSIVVVGPDAVVPQARLRDDTVLSNEEEYADDARFGDSDDAVSGALRDAYFLTDDPYGDFNAAKSMYVPDVALGRLVETAPEITAQLQRFLDTNGRIDPQDAVVMGYEFFQDGSEEEAAGFEAGFPTTLDVSNWDAAAALRTINRESTGISAVNAHYDSHRALPAAAFFGDGSPNLLYAENADPKPGSLLFNMGCHSGLNISARVAAPTAQERLRLGDWAEKMAQSDALYAGSTTFSYGDTEAVAYTERILALMAQGIGTKQVTVGQALTLGKQRGLATMLVLDAYWIKASQALTFYGLPMYTIAGDAKGASSMPPLSPKVEGTRTSDPRSFSLASKLRRIDGPRGTHWEVEGHEPLVVQRRPVQPVVSADVTSGDGRAKGYLIESLTTREVPVSDPVIARPTVDLAAHEPEPSAVAPFFPATLATVTTEATADGLKDRLTLAAGQFRGDRQRLFDEVGGRVLRSSGTDNLPVRIRRVDGAVEGSSFAIRVEVDGGDAIGGTVLYRTATDTSGGVTTWRRADLAVIGDGLLGTGGSMPAGTTEIEEAIVQVVDEGNNVALSDFKVKGFSFTEVRAPQPGDPKLAFEPEVPASGYLQTVPRITLDAGDHGGATFERRVDGGPWQPIAPGEAFTLPDPADGHHLVEVRGSDGSSAARAVAIDREGPVVTGEADRASNEHGWYDGPVTVSFRCADAVSGVASCPAPQRLEGEGRGQSASGTATDRAGNSAGGSLGGIDIDLTDPGIEASVQGVRSSTGWYTGRPTTVRFSCSDALSGIARCPDDVALSDGADQVVEGTAEDRAGRRRSASVEVDVDTTKPEVAITTADAIVIGQQLQGTASDATSGVDRVVVTYTNNVSRAVTTRTAVLTCGAGGACTWTAQTPGLGSYQVTAVATDRATLSASASRTAITIG